MQYVTLVNRTTRTLRGTWDGRVYSLLPGQNHFPEAMARKFMEQNPIMGSEDYFSGQKEYLLGIAENNDPIEPVEQAESIELLNRSQMPEASRKAEVVKGAGGLYSYEKHSPLANPNSPVTSTFEK